jgi:hypothetical protein
MFFGIASWEPIRCTVHPLPHIKDKKQTGVCICDSYDLDLTIQENIDSSLTAFSDKALQHDSTLSN